MIESFFIAGIMQGSLPHPGIRNQEYRKQIKGILVQHYPQARIVCPLEENPNSAAYSDETGREVFFSLLRQATGVQVMVAFLPEASMGTALEMWEAYRHGVPVWCISPLKHNWVVKYLADKVFPDIEAFGEYVAGISPVGESKS